MMTQKISIIVAMERRKGMGKNNHLPWTMPADLAYFKKMTLGKPILMGRNTYESMGRPLPKRQNIVLTRDHNYSPAEGVFVFDSLEKALAAFQEAPEIMLIGGTEIFRRGLSLATDLYITHIDALCDADTFFPEYDLTQWKLMWEEAHTKDEANPFNYRFCHYQRLPVIPAQAGIH
jgi:dihydrofolate reductase